MQAGLNSQVSALQVSQGGQQGLISSEQAPQGAASSSDTCVWALLPRERAQLSHHFVVTRQTLENTSGSPKQHMGHGFSYFSVVKTEENTEKTLPRFSFFHSVCFCSFTEENALTLP